MMKTRFLNLWIWAVSLVSLPGIFVAQLGSASVELSTYYPIPNGNYKTIQVSDWAHLAVKSGGVGIGTTNTGGRTLRVDGDVKVEGDLDILGDLAVTKTVTATGCISARCLCLSDAPADGWTNPDCKCNW